MSNHIEYLYTMQMSRFRVRSKPPQRSLPTRVDSTLQVDGSGLLAPSLLALALLIFGILCTLVPVDLYQTTIREKDYMFGNWPVYLYLGLCTGSFILAAGLGGVIANRRKGHAVPWFQKSFGASGQKVTHLIFILSLLNVFLSLVRLIYMQLTIGIANILGTFTGGGGSQLREDIIAAIADGKVGWISDDTLGFTVAIWWLASQGWQRNKNLKLFAWGNLILFAFTNFLSLSRDILLTGVLMIVIILLSRLRTQGVKNKLRAFSLLFVGIILFSGVFAVIGGARSSGGQDTLVRQFMGYFPASYNRLAAEMSGQLTYPNSGWGFYSTQLFWDLPVVTNIFNLYDVGKAIGIDLPQNSIDNWERQFSQVTAATLNRSYIWPTAYGFAYADFGWFGFLYFILYGFLAGTLYVKFRKQTLFGGLVYPYIVVTIVKWWSILSLSSRTFFIIFSVAIVVWTVWQLSRPIAHDSYQPFPEKNLEF